jgi:hypothetical protein
MGPGTDIVRNIRDGVPPIGPVDYTAQQHDIDYLGNEEPTRSDIKAIINGIVKGKDNKLAATAMALGLGSRLISDQMLGNNHKLTHFNSSTPVDKELQHELYSMTAYRDPFFWLNNKGKW